MRQQATCRTKQITCRASIKQAAAAAARDTNASINRIIQAPLDNLQQNIDRPLFRTDSADPSITKTNKRIRFQSRASGTIYGTKTNPNDLKKSQKLYQLTFLTMYIVFFLKELLFGVARSDRLTNTSQISTLHHHFCPNLHRLRQSLYAHHFKFHTFYATKFNVL